MPSHSDQIVSKQNLKISERDFCEEFVSKNALNGTFVGAIRAASTINPILLHGKQLVYLKISPEISTKEQVLLKHLSAVQKKVQEFKLIQGEFAYGEYNNHFWCLRNYHQLTLAGYLDSNQLNKEQANQFLLKILNLLLDLRRKNISHGHLSPSNFILKKEELNLVDFEIAYCCKKDSGLSSLPPESSSELTPSFKSDVYGFGNLIKTLYSGQQCPIPLDVPDKMCSVDPSDRPSLLEVNNIITDIFERKRHKTEVWNGPVVKKDSDDPAAAFVNYLTPELIQQIRATYKAKHQQAENQEEQVLQKQQPKSQDFLFTLILTAIICFVLWRFAFNTQGIPGSSQTGNAQSTVVASPTPDQNPKIKYALQFLEQAKVPELDKIKKIFKNNPPNKYSPDFLKVFITKFDLLELQQLKLQALMILFSEDLADLENIFQDLKENNLLKPFFDWFDNNELAGWKDVEATTKLLMISQTVPENVLSIEQYFDLALHFDPIISEQSRQLLLTINTDNQNAFYESLLGLANYFTRAQISTLLIALQEDKDKKGALIFQWYEIVKPKPEVVLKLALARIKPQADEDLFSYYTADYIKDLEMTLDSETLKAMLNHHEKLLQVKAKIYQSENKN